MASEGDIVDAFQWAVKNGEIDNVKTLLNKQPDLVNKVMQGRCALHYAADFGHTEVVELLCDKGAKVNEEDKFGITPLLSAVFEQHKETVAALLKKGASKDAKFDGKSCLEHADTDDIKGLLKG